MNTAPLTAPISALVADDEEAPRQQLVSALHKAWPELQVVAEAVNGVDAWDAWLEHEPDLCFLDIRMPGLSGIDVARRIGGRTPVVFVTAYGDHALAAFDAGAVDYVMKPVEPARLAQALERVRSRLQPSATVPAAPVASASKPDLASLQAVLDQLAGLDHLKRRAAPLAVIQAGVGKEVRLIRVADVVFFESDARYTRVVYRSDGVDGEALIRTPLKELLAQIDEHEFWQVHRSVIVNRLQVAAAVRVDEGHMHLTLRGRSEKLPVSRHFQGLFKAQ
ncbi:MAG: response regulator transcription factor [Rubrivivax sp.]|nr:response regulator transcription factor [Rubrivivax sp.]